MKKKVSELILGESVQVFDGAYGTATVYQKLPNGNARVWRPYVTTNDVTYSNNQTIPFIGLEDFELVASSEVKVVK